MKCRKFTCPANAERFFVFNGGLHRACLCGPCAVTWLSDQPNFRPDEITESEYLDLERVVEVMGS